jgi:hypothetical protein
MGGRIEEVLGGTSRKFDAAVLVELVQSKVFQN